uniref:Ubiquitinyl hydrolase 1 n=1 Tax=Panagrolaimus sp. PS1159 TaxID=55785 RepID=A0AC35FXJ4_9BILA
MLIQRNEFDASQLTNYVERLDQREMEVAGIPYEMFQSQNASESGFFSIQVLTEALMSQGLLIFDINKPKYVHYMFQPEEAQAFIVNQSQHWFTLRRFGDMWFILNSVSKGPRFIATTLLKEYFEKLIKNRASIYVVEGELEICEADIAALNDDLIIIDGILELEDLNTVVNTVGYNNEDDEMQKALAASLEFDKAAAERRQSATAEEIRLKREKFLSSMN